MAISSKIIDYQELQTPTGRFWYAIQTRQDGKTRQSAKFYEDHTDLVAAMSFGTHKWTEDWIMERPGCIEIDGELVQPFETEKAYRFYDGKTTDWVPKSQVDWHPERPDSYDGTMVMPKWLAEEKGFV